MFAALAKLVSRYPRWVLAAWFVLAAGSLPLGMRLGEVLTGQPEAPGSGDAAAVRRVLGARFAQAEEEALVAVAHGAGTRAGTPEYDAALDEVQVRLLLVDHVTYVRDHRSPTGLVLLDEEANLSVVQVGLDVTDMREGKEAASKVRAVLRDVAGLRFDVSGGPATVVELERVSERDARRAELYAQAEDRLFGPNGSFPVIPLYLTTSAWLQQPWLSGVNEYGPARFDLWTIDTSQQAG